MSEPPGSRPRLSVAASRTLTTTWLVTILAAAAGCVLTVLVRSSIARGDLIGTFLLFPDGRLPSSRWWPAAWFFAVVAVLGMTGFAMGGIAVLILILALIARPGARQVVLAAVLVLQTVLLQSLLAGLGDDSPVWGGLHALDGVLAIGVAGYLYGVALVRRRTAARDLR